MLSYFLESKLFQIKYFTLTNIFLSVKINVVGYSEELKSEPFHPVWISKSTEPHQTIVVDLATVAAVLSRDFGPDSKIMRPTGMA